MKTVFSDGILNTPSSFIRDILKVTEEKDMISFAGGLPNPISFPMKELQNSSNRVIQQYGSKVFQYASSQGYETLREYIAKRYQTKYGLDYCKEDILITTGSQQALDLLGKTLLNKGDYIGIEKPGYLGAIQTCSYYQPHFCEIEMQEDGINLDELESILKKHSLKFLYTVPNFQNPTGITYSKKKREDLHELLSSYNTILIEDDPYGDLRFSGEDLPYIGADKLEGSVLLGSISKIITPGFRLGWICTKNHELLDHLIVAKQAADLHSNIYAQYTISDYLLHNDLDTHIAEIRKLYRTQSKAMQQAIKDFFPGGVKATAPEGGMFLWITLPNSQSALELFPKAIAQKVAFVPGDPFYISEQNVSAMRLNYTNTDPDIIRVGIKRMARLFA